MGTYDWLIVGAGYTGAVLAERIATQLGQRVLVVDRREHIAGNAYDFVDESGILVHKYGPHFFHTNARRVWDYLSKFTQWLPYEHRTLAEIDGKLVPVPFNLTSLQMLFPVAKAARLNRLLLGRYGIDTKVPILRMREECVGELRDLANFIYDKVFDGYTTKQWGLKPEELAPSVTARVPIHISFDDRYFQDTYQAMPLDGYTKMFERMLAHQNITVQLGTDYREADVKFGRMIYTGPIDSFFNYAHGVLPYRSLRFEFETLNQAVYQPVAQVNFPNSQDYTRITEFKHATGFREGNAAQPQTTIVREYPQAHEIGKNEAFYPIPRDEYRTLFNQYRQDADALNGSVIFSGRLADYQYYNMDQVVARALVVFEQEIAGDTTDRLRGAGDAQPRSAAA